MELTRNLLLETLPETFPARLSPSEIINELKKYLNPENEVVHGPELQQVIVYYAEQTIEPIGWQALWIYDSKSKSSLKPTLTSPSLVEVTNVDYQSLEATVDVIDDTSQETRSATVLLTELHPLKHQENSAINIEATHNAIQKIRFFYNHLLLPWDSDIQENWFEVHLPVRVKMFCELRSGMLNQETAVRYHYLLSEAYEVEKKLQALAEKVQFSEDEMEDEVVGDITALNSKLEQIQQDVEIILNPSTRMLLFGSKVTRMKSDERPEVLLVVQDQNCLSLHQTLNQLESEFSPQLNLRCYPSLQTALDDCRVDDVIVVSKGIHSLLNINSLRHGGSLLGIGSKEDIVIHLGCNSEVGLTFDDGTTTLKNCTILVNNKQSGVAVKGYVTMENCVMRGTPTDVGENDDQEAGGSWKGFYVAAQSKLSLKNCSITNFDVGLRVRATGKVLLTACDVTACNIGILAEQNTCVQLSNTEFKDCKEYAIGIEMDSESIGETLFGNEELLELVQETFKITGCRFIDNAANVKLEY